MPVSKVIYAGETLVDLTEDTVTPETLAEGVTAHDKTGAQITGTYKGGEDLNAVLTEQETLIAELQAALMGKGSAWYDAFWDAYQENGDRWQYAGAFAGAGWTKKTFMPKYRIKPVGSVSAERMFYYFNRISSSASLSDAFDFTLFNDLLDFSGITKLDSTFADARIKNLFVDASTVTSVSSAFRSGNGGVIDGLTLRVTKACTSFSSTFAYQSKLAYLRFTDDSEIAASIDFKASTILSKDSIISVVNALSDTSTGKTVTFSKTAVTTAFGGIDTEELLALESMKPNWTFAYA